MKSKILAATGFAAALLIVACTLFQHKKNKIETNVIAGRYKLLNITDSTETKKWLRGDTLKYFFDAFKDSSAKYINFGSDSLATVEAATKTDSIKYYIDAANKIVYMQNDSAYHPFKFSKQTDSVINLYAADDSIYLALKKL